mgnify:CR=1 FL=1|jgi:hypothetical protein|tara:strand:- start:130 stop:636 length:507 start_codon:yes stop_codon:yes gene_type:complete
MQLPMYNISIPMFINHFSILSEILLKAEKDAERRKIDKSIFINARLAPDMMPLVKQIQIGTDMVKLGIARLAGIKAPIFKDNESTFSDLQKRIQKTIKFLKKIKEKQMDGSDLKKIEFPIRKRIFKFKNGYTYLSEWIIPHFFFHMTTTYAILRANGVKLGKRDFVKM